MPLRRTIVVIGLIFMLAGLPVFIFPAQEAHTETVEIGEWDLQSQELEPLGQDPDSIFHARLMAPEWWFQLNLSSSGPIEVQVSIIRGQVEKDPIFRQTGTSFSQTVLAWFTGTYVIDVQNISPSSVTVDGNVLAKKPVTNYDTVYPYALPGFLMILGGTSALIFGIFKKPSKSKRTMAKKSRE